MRTLGDDFFTMLRNLDSLHESFLPSFPKMCTPSIRPQRNDDGTLSVHYYSESVGLAPFMMGTLKASAMKIYDLEIDIRHRTKKGNGSNHDVFHIFMDERCVGCMVWGGNRTKKKKTKGKEQSRCAWGTPGKEGQRAQYASNPERTY